MELRPTLPGRLPGPIEATAYSVVAEALTKVAKDAGATAATVSVGRSGGRVHIEVHDDGAGGATLDGGSGLRGLADRVEAVGGTLRVDSPAGDGTLVAASVPAECSARARGGDSRTSPGRGSRRAGVDGPISRGRARIYGRSHDRDPRLRCLPRPPATPRSTSATRLPAFRAAARGSSSSAARSSSSSTRARAGPAARARSSSARRPCCGTPGRGSAQHVTADEEELSAVVGGADGRRLVVAGGDGTVHALANLDLPAPPAAALLPAGRANNIARALGIPVDWAAAAELAVRGRPRRVDALHVATPDRTLYAVEGVSAGFHAAARHRYRGENSADLLAGVRALATELLAYRQRPVGLCVDGGRAFDAPAAQVFLANLPFFGFGFRVDPEADPRDGRLEAIVLEAATRREVVRLLAAAREGRHLDRPGVSWSRGMRARLDRPLPLVADAQPLGVTTAIVTVAAGHLRLVVPEAAA